MTYGKQWILTGAMAALLALPAVSASERGRPAGAVVELFTSQGCYSCPPADALLAEVIHRRPDVVALEFHVDYWDQLVYGASGSWRDPFSHPDYTARQRRYHALELDGRRGVYTPQAIVNGEHALVGSDRDQMYRNLKVAAQLPVDVFIEARGDVLGVHLQGPAGNAADIWHVTFLESASTPVTTGENHGKYLKNHHVVTGFSHIGRWWGSSPGLTIEAPSAGSGSSCAVLVQEPAGQIIGAAYCPQS
jgi:hypothetical protein